jgi:predicted HTH domain antitoxin
MQTIDIKVQFPKEMFIATHISKENIQTEIKEALAMKLFNEGILSFGKATQLAEISKWEFMELLRRNKIPLVRYDLEDLEEDIKVAKEISTL